MNHTHTDDYWLKKAKKYIVEHNAFHDVSDIRCGEHGDSAYISANVSIGLPSKFIEKGVTDIGVRHSEKVTFIFHESFPLVAPALILRDDFPRVFPHINPSLTRVSPCIYEGNLSELLQQSEWMNGILNQLVDWLEKAASNDLLNYDQGWEPMRNDDFQGVITYNIDHVLSKYGSENTSVLERRMNYENRNNIIIAGSLCNPKQPKNAQAVYLLTDDVIDSYISNSINTLQDLYEYAESIGISAIRKSLEISDKNNIDDDILFVVLSVKRPVNLIGSVHNIEFLNFVINKTAIRRKKSRKLKRVLPECKVDTLTHISERSTMLLKRLSGTQTKISESGYIALVGCGSLGSKVGMHLVRNGNSPLLCIDKNIFLPHNNARHALTSIMANNKAELLSLEMFSASGILPKVEGVSALNVDYSDSRIIIDTTASLSVRHFFMNHPEFPPVVSGGLYDGGQSGLLLIESKTKSTVLTQLWAHLYQLSLYRTDLKKMLYSNNQDNAQIGQSCSSQTMILDDSRISKFASTMSEIVQELVENDMPEEGAIYLINASVDHSITTESIAIPAFIPIQSKRDAEWEIVVSREAQQQMLTLLKAKAPLETGGVLLGTVFLFARKVVVTGMLPAPPDSLEERHLFVLGTEGLEQEIKQVEKNTNGKVTYLGTWHSHPGGGGASQTDTNTFKKLLFVRNYEPTICLIVTRDQMIVV